MRRRLERSPEGKHVGQRERVVLYARVSSEEQAKGNYNSCQSQIEELQKFCSANGYEVIEAIKDEGYSGGNLRRPGLSRVRQLVEEGAVDMVYSTWYDRFIRTREFYQLDAEFRAKNVRFKTVHDATNTDTATGRFSESMYVAMKTFEREQTSEKVRRKMHMRAEKGMWNGGKIPFGFISINSDRVIVPDLEKKMILNELFRIYVETGSDTKVREWLEANQIPARSGSARWQVSTITTMLTNRRYIAQIEINRENKGLDGLPEEAAYRVVPTAYEPIVDIELFETAQIIREKRAVESPNRVGRPRSFSQTQCNRLYTLQGLLYCEHCGHSMTPYYIRHKAGIEKNGKKRNTDSFVNYYVCAKQVKGWKACDHRNCISASKTEKWALKVVSLLISVDGLLDQVINKAREKSQVDLQPTYEALRDNAEVLRALGVDEEKLVQLATNSDLSGDLLDLLSGKATRIRRQKETLLMEKARLQGIVSTSQVEVDVEKVRAALGDFNALIAYAEPGEVQRLLKLLIHRIEWSPQEKGQEAKNHKVQFYSLMPQNVQSPTSKGKQGIGVLNCDTLRYRVALQLLTTILEVEMIFQGEVLVDTARWKSL